MSGWPSSLRCCVQVAVGFTRLDIESHFWHFSFSFYTVINCIIINKVNYCNICRRMSDGQAVWGAAFRSQSGSPGVGSSPTSDIFIFHLTQWLIVINKVKYCSICRRMSGWPSGLRRCVQVAVGFSRRGFESHFWHFSPFISHSNCNEQSKITYLGECQDGRAV